MNFVIICKIQYVGGLTRDLSRAIHNGQNSSSHVNGGNPGLDNPFSNGANHIENNGVSGVQINGENSSSLAALMAEDFSRDMMVKSDAIHDLDKLKPGFQCPICFKTLSSKNNLKESHLYTLHL